MLPSAFIGKGGDTCICLWGLSRGKRIPPVIQDYSCMFVFVCYVGSLVVFVQGTKSQETSLELFRCYPTRCILFRWSPAR